MQACIAAALDPETVLQELLRLPAEAATDALLGVFIGRAGGLRSGTPATTEQLVDLFLHGAARSQETA